MRTIIRGISSKRNIMKNSHKGQTVIETALVIMLLFILFFGIAEIARAWYMKNALNNAARVGVRVAIVTPGITDTGGVFVSLPPPPADCNDASVTGNNKVFCVIAKASGIPSGTTVSITFDPSLLQSGTAITVGVRATFVSVIPGLTAPTPGGFGFTSLFSFLRTRPLTTQSTMRYE
jgi:hypothetical protein